MKIRATMIAIACVAAAACGDGGGDGGGDGDENNSTENNSTENNSTENNSTENNSTENNTENNSTENNTENNVSPLTCNPTFGAAEACGGEIAESWDLAEVCSSFDYASLLEDACPDLTVTDTRYDLTGGLSAFAGLFSYGLLGTVEVDAEVPASCSNAVGGCSGVETSLGLVAKSATCTEAGEGCDCTAVFEPDIASEGGYETAGGIATVDDEDEWYYCVQGDTLLLREVGDDNRDRPTFLLTK